jgi:chloramphenicol-sensitive protein RarD
MMNRVPDSRDHAASRRGFIYGVAAYGLWGVLPIYFKLLEAVPPVDIVAQRVLWSIPVLAFLVSVTGGWTKVRQAFRERTTILLLIASAALIGVNWVLYVYAVNSGHILAGSLGYYLNPLANVLLGRLVLKERLTKLQWVAVAIAAAGIAVLAVQALSQLWISLTLCASFATYGLVRKVAPVDALPGLTIETLLLAPLSLAWLVFSLAAGNHSFGISTNDTLLLALAGLVTATPLLLFTAAARRLRLSTLGMLQFLAPTFQFVIAVFVYGEPFTRSHAIAFAAIWSALAIYVFAMLHNARVSVVIPE